VKHEQNLDCGGGYIKLAPSGVDQAKFGGDSEYSIMFGVRRAVRLCLARAAVWRKLAGSD
jgi:hypothetical protein